MEVSAAMARLFLDQCIGTYSGHMAAIPHNPVLASICLANGVDSYKPESFPSFLRGVANALDPNPRPSQTNENQSHN